MIFNCTLIELYLRYSHIIAACGYIGDMAVKQESIDKTNAALELLNNEFIVENVLLKVDISRKAFYDCLNEYPKLKDKYNSVRLSHADQMVDQALVIADTCLNPHRARNQIELRKWIASKLHPATYGDKIDLNVTNTVDISGAIEAARARVVARSVDKLDQSLDTIGIEDKTSLSELLK